MTTSTSHPLLSKARVMLLAVGAAMTPLMLSAEAWTGQVTAYGWGSGVKGDFTPVTGAPTLSFDKSLSELLEDLDGAFFMTGLARRGDVVIFGDYTYSSSSREGLVPPGIPASGELTMQSLTVAAGLRFDVAEGGTIDVLGGLRSWKIKGRVTVPLAGVDIAPEQTFIDPIFGLRANAVLSDRWSVLGYADIGGFGVGSDQTWQAAVTANYRATDNLFLSAGWRELYVDYAKSGTEFDGSMAGPIVGATFTF